MVLLKAYEDYNDRFAPAGAKKAYVARLVGRDSKMTFDREFLGKGDVMVDAPGIYETRSVDKKGRPDEPDYILLLDCPAFPSENGQTLSSFVATKEQAMKIAKALDEGRSIDGIARVVDASGKTRSERTWELLTAREAAKTQAAQTVDAAIDACWQIMANLPEKEAKKVVAALKAKVSPPKTQSDEEMVKVLCL